jgi:hypothetical protein
MTWNYFAAKWLKQFHHGWLTPLLCPQTLKTLTLLNGAIRMKELERFNDGLQFFHVAVTLASRGAFQSEAIRSTRSWQLLNANAITNFRNRIVIRSGAKPSGNILQSAPPFCEGISRFLPE